MITFFFMTRSPAKTVADPKASSSASTTVSVAPTPVPATSISASASSTQNQNGAITYTAANTLDARPDTAWNSNGGGAGITLTYTFAQPVHLSGITMLDGYQKATKKGDLWALNSRAKTITVTTDTGNWAWDLTDTRDLQKLTQDLGTTSTLTLKIDDVYAGAKYDDIAISEVSFLAVG